MLKPILIHSLFALSLLGCGREAVPTGGPSGGASVPSASPETPADSAEASSPPLRLYHGFERQQLCQLKLHKEWYETGVENRENYRAEVSTSYEHDGASAGKIVLKFVPDSDGLKLAWDDTATGQYLHLDLLEPSTSIQHPSEFKIRWLHGRNHHHTNTCATLR